MVTHVDRQNGGADFLSAASPDGRSSQGEPGLRKDLNVLTIQYVEYECHHWTTGGGVGDVHGELSNFGLERLLVQLRLILPQILQCDNTTLKKIITFLKWEENGYVQNAYRFEQLCFFFYLLPVPH